MKHAICLLTFLTTHECIIHEKISRNDIKSNKLKTKASTCGNEFELFDSSHSVRDIEEYIKYIIKIIKHYPRTPSVHICVNIINSRLFLK